MRPAHPETGAPNGVLGHSGRGRGDGQPNQQTTTPSGMHRAEKTTVAAHAANDA
jgi:hypothetical protein